MSEDAKATTGTCLLCNQQAEGHSYRLYHGWQADQRTTSDNLIVATVSTTKTTYRIGGSMDVFLCDMCVWREHRASSRKTGVILLIMAALLVFLAIEETIRLSAYRSGTNWPLWCLAPGILLALIAFIGLFSKQTTTGEGEETAVKAARKKRLAGAGAIYWTTKEYEKLIKKQK